MFLCRSLLRTAILPHRRDFPLARAYALTTPQPSTTVIDHYVQLLKSASSLHAIDTHYHNLVRILKEQEKQGSFPTNQILSKGQVSKIIWHYAKSGRQFHLQRIKEILLDMPLVFCMEPTIDTHTTIIQGLIHRGDVQLIWDWLRDMPKHPPHLPPIPEHYHMVLESCVDMTGCSYKLARALVARMPKHGCNPTTDTYLHLVRARWKYFDRDGASTPPPVPVFVAMSEDMQRGGLPFDPSFGELLYEEYSKRGFPVWGEQARRLYQNRLQKRQSPEQLAMAKQALRLAHTIQAKGMRAALSLYRSWNNHNPPPPSIIQELLQHSRQLSDLHLIEEEWDIQCDASHWTLLITNSTRADKLDDALAIYEASKRSGIAPNPPMISPLIRALCQSNFGPPREASIDRALLIFQDLRANALQKEQMPDESEDEPGSVEQDIYATLLRGLATTQSTSKYANIAREIMDDMTARNYTPDDSDTVSAIIVLYMRRCQNMEEALEVYRRFKSSLDEKGYAIVLGAFCKLRFSRGIEIPSLKGYFEIVKDMRLAGLETTIEVYTILLKQLGSVATELQRYDDPNVDEMRNSLIITARRAHDLLTLDASLSPDAILWNQMMDTYQRLGCFADAYRVWDLMYVTGRFNEASVSVILDACGFAGAYSIAKQIITRLRRDKYQFTLRHWNTWLECLCRLGRLEEAVKALCTEMGREGNVKPNVDSVEIVAKFARGVGREGDVLARVQKYWPDLVSSPSSSYKGVI